MGRVAIRFLQDHTKQDPYAGTPDATHYRTGQVVRVREDTARHYMRRGIAERVNEAALDAARAPSRPPAPAGRQPKPAATGDAGKPDAGKADPKDAGKTELKEGPKAEAAKDGGKADPKEGSRAEAAKDGGKK